MTTYQFEAYFPHECDFCNMTAKYEYHKIEGFFGFNWLVRYFCSQHLAKWKKLNKAERKLVLQGKMVL